MMILRSKLRCRSQLCSNLKQKCELAGKITILHAVSKQNILYFYFLFLIKKLCVYMCGWQFGVAVMRWSRSTQLLYIEPG